MENPRLQKFRNLVGDIYIYVTSQKSKENNCVHFTFQGGSQISIPVIGVEIPLEFILGMVFIFSNLITRAVGLPPILDNPLIAQQPPGDDKQFWWQQITAQNDGLEKVAPFKSGHFLVSMIIYVQFMGGIINENSTDSPDESSTNSAVRIICRWMRSVVCNSQGLFELRLNCPTCNAMPSYFFGPRNRAWFSSW